MKNLQQRLLMSAIMIALLCLLIYFSQNPIVKPILTAVLATVASAALWEYYQISKAKGYEPLVRIGITITIAYVFSIFLSMQNPRFDLAPSIVLFLGLLISFLYYFTNEGKPLSNLAVTLFGVGYLALPLSFALSILYFFPAHSMQDGRWWLVYVIAVTKMTDTGAYFIGKKYGKRQLAAKISPKKTVEGAIGGLITAIIVSLLIPLIANYLDSPQVFLISTWQSIYLGMAIGILSQIGDLGESLLKRDAGIKDSNQLPGLGGMLDIVDSLIFTLPLVYFFMEYR